MKRSAKFTIAFDDAGDLRWYLTAGNGAEFTATYRVVAEGTASGSGTGAQIILTYGVNTIAVDDGGTLYECPQCSERFNVAGLRDGHARTRHVKSQYRPPAPPIREPGESIDNYQNRLDEWAKAAGAAADAADERRDNIENEIAPLDLEKTAASRNA